MCGKNLKKREATLNYEEKEILQSSEKYLEETPQEIKEIENKLAAGESFLTDSNWQTIFNGFFEY